MVSGRWVGGFNKTDCFRQLLLIYRKMLNMKLNMVLIVLMETLDIPKIYKRLMNTCNLSK